MISRNSISDAFPIKRLGDVVEFLDSKRRPVTESERRAGPYPYYGANGIQGTIDSFIFDEPLVLLAEDGGHFDDPDRGIAYRISGKTWVNNHAHVLRPTSAIDLAYLCRVLENYDVKPFVTGTTRGKLTKAGASEIAIPLPSLAEQRRIAEVLDRAEALRAKRRAALAELDALTQSLFLDLFGDPAANPKGWPIITLGDTLVAIRNGANAEQSTEPGGWPITRIETIADGTINPQRVRWIKPDDSLIEGFQLQPGDILFSHINSVEHIAKTALYSGDPTPLIHGINLLRLRPKLDSVEPIWLLYFLKHDLVRTHFRTRCKRAVNQASLNQPDIKSLEIYLPPLALQQEFARRVAAVEKLKQAQRTALTELDTLFATLQHRAFRGGL